MHDGGFYHLSYTARDQATVCVCLAGRRSQAEFSGKSVEFSFTVGDSLNRQSQESQIDKAYDSWDYLQLSDYF